MADEQRKASEVILDLESKIDMILGIVKTQDLTIKLISNKLNSLIEKQSIKPQIMIEAVNTSQQQPKEILVSSDFNLKLEENPNGFRRTSRPETYAGDNAFLPQKPKDVEPKFPVQIPNQSGHAEVIVPVNKKHNTDTPAPTHTDTPVKKEKLHSFSGNTIPVTQRVVDANGKSAFLADVEIISLENMQQIFKNRTNGAGKWSAPLSVGSYRVIIHKRESLTKDKLEAIQDIKIDGNKSPLELQTIILKK